jgi:hypothetical protein
MRTRSKLLLALAIATGAMALATGAASARRLEFSSQSFRLVWPNWRFEWTFIGEMTCPVTLEGSFHSRTLSKVCGQLVGYITRAVSASTVPPCRNGTVTMLAATLPWHVRYVSFAGTLPAIARITVQIVGMSYRITAGTGATCLVETTAAHPYVGIFGRNTTTGRLAEFTSDETAAIPVEEEVNCMFAGTAHNTSGAEVSVQGTTTAITVRLVQ